MGTQISAVEAARPSLEPVSIALVAHDVGDTGGMEHALAELIRRAPKDFRFTVISTTLAADLRSRVQWRRVWAPRRPFPLKFLVFFLLAWVKLVGLKRDLLHTLGAIIPNKVDVVTVQFCHAGFVAKIGRLAPPGLPRLKRLNVSLSRLLALGCERWTYRRGWASVAVAVSQGVGHEVSRHYPGIPVAIIPNGVDALTAGKVMSKGSVRLDLCVSSSAIVFLFVGGDWWRKGVDLAIEALSRARMRGLPDLVLWIVGDGDVDRFRRMAVKFNVQDRVVFFGQSPPERFYADADVFLFPTMYEAFSLATLEAAAAGLPLITTRVNGSDELFGEKVGILVDREAGEIADAMIRLATDAELRRRLGNQARQRAQFLTWDQMAAQTADLYRRVSSGGARG